MSRMNVCGFIGGGIVEVYKGQSKTMCSPIRVGQFEARNKTERKMKNMTKKMITIAIAGFALSLFAGEEYPELPRKITDETPAQKAERLAW